MFTIGMLVMEMLKFGIALPTSNMQGPSFHEEPPDFLEFTNSSGAVLDCIGDGNPMPDVRWVDISNKDIAIIPRLREMLTNGSLYFPPFESHSFRSEVHMTIYRCILTNTVGSIVSRECRIRTNVIHTLDVHVPNVFVIRGNVAAMKCVTSNMIRGHIFAISWMKDNPTDGRTLITPGGRYLETQSGELHVRDVNEDDANVQFFCQMTNRITGERYFSRPGSIVITEAENHIAPRVESSSSNTQARVGNAVDLICVAQGYPPPTYRWYHEVAGSLQEIRSGAASFVRPQTSVLRFPRVQMSDSSTYVCVASNAAGEDRRQIRLLVYSPLIAFIRPQKQVVDSGSHALFNCSVQGGSGESSVYWLKDGKRMYTNQNVDIMNRGETLLLKSVNRDDSGMYQCYAQNQDETAQASAQLILGAVSPELEITFSEEILQPGGPLSLRCVANGNPPPRISWLLDGGPIHAGDGFFIGSYSDSKGSVVGHLNITNVRIEHGGYYTCMARNFLGVVDHSAMVNVYGPPTSRGILNLTAVSATNVYLRCPVSGYPLTSTTWYLGNEAVTDNSNRKIFVNGTLLLSNLDEETDKGKLTCKVYNQLGLMATGTVYLNIMNPPEIMPFHFSSNLKEGGKTNIVCSISSGDLPIQFAWRKDGKPLVRDVDIREHAMEMVSTLRIDNLAARHSGLYTCVATNPAASANYTAKLIVKASPTWSIEPQDTTVVFKNSVVINCKADGFPTPKISWTKSKDNNDFSQLESNSRMIIFGNGSIGIQNAEKLHEGYYNCQADNGIGSSISKSIFLKVQIPAHFRIKHLNQSGIAGQKMVLICEAEGDFPLRVTWSSPPNAAVHTRHTTTSLVSELHLDQLKRSHIGEYRCTASNSFGYDHMAINLAVKEPPDSPSNLEVTDKGSRWFKINWTTMETDNDRYFVAQFRPLHEIIWSNVTLSNSPDMYRIDQLLPNTLYLIRLVAVNEVGRSKPSVEVLAKTLQEVPGEFPTNIAVEKVTKESVSLKWKPISANFWNGEAIGYRAYFVESNRNTVAATKTVRGDAADTAKVNNLKAYTTYSVSMRAFNVIGEGPASPAISVTTMEATPSNPVQNLHCSPYIPSTLLVRWDPPPRENWNGVINRYKVSCRPTSAKYGMKLKSTYYTVTDTQIIIHGLDNYVNYTIRVMTATAAGGGIWSQYIQCTTKEDIPKAPDDVKVLAMTSESILIVWDTPKDPGGKIIQYNVYVQSNNNKAKKEVVMGDGILKHEFRHLTEHQRYEFWISASSAIGEGQSSVKVTQIPSSRVPARISSFSKTIVGISGSHLTLECNAVGLPTPARNWKRLGGTLPTESRLLLDKSLWMSDIKLEDAGNYTCVAENVFGKDEVTYSVKIVQPPLPCKLYLKPHEDELTVFLKWDLDGDGGSSITGFILTVKSENDDRQLMFDPNTNSQPVGNLKCGGFYEFNIQAVNMVGVSPYSNWISTKMPGEEPPSAKEDVLFANSTSVTLYLDGWPEKDCPVRSFQVAYREAEGSWVPFGAIPPQLFTIDELQPATLYNIRVAAFNEAGKATQEFTVVTRSANGEILPVELFNRSKASLFFQVDFIIPVISGMISMVSIIFCGFMLLKRRKLISRAKSGETTLNSSRVELENSQNNQQLLHSQQNTYSPSHILKKKSAFNTPNDKTIDDYEVYPYATFTVPTHLQTFTQRDCSDGNMCDNTYSLQRKRKNSSKNNTDPLNIEIACISNQQTLPVGRKSAFNTVTTSFHDSDSSCITPVTRHKKHYCKRTSDITPESSTESAEVSPEVMRKPRVRMCPSSRINTKQSPKPLKSFSSSCEISEPDSEQNFTDKSDSKLLQHEKFNEELSSIVNEYRKRRTRNEQHDALDF